MTLGGMAIAIGELVDDAIIDVENVFRRLRENAHLPEDERRSPLAVVYHASVEVRASVVFATLIILLVFLPVFFLGGVEGRLLQPLGVAYIVSLFASLVVALTLTPALCSLLLPNSKAVLSEHEPWVVRSLKGLYARVLGPTLRHPTPVIVPALALFVLALASMPFMGQAFLPEFNEGSLDDQCGDPAGDLAPAIRRAGPGGRERAPLAPGGDRGRSPHRPGRARRARPGGRGGRARRLLQARRTGRRRSSWRPCGRTSRSSPA